MTWLAVLASAVLFGGARAARADGDAAPPPLPSQSEVHLQIGGAPLGPVKPGHEVRVTSDSEGTRLLAVDTTGAIGANISTSNGFDAPRQAVCVAPCTAKLSPSGTYMTRGWGLTDSPHFGISEQTTDVKIHAGSAIESAFGATSLSVGLLGLIGGATLVPLALAQDAGSPNRHTFMTIGAAAAGGGAALVVLGLVLSFVSTTHVYDGRGARLASGHGLRLTSSGLVF